MQLILLRYYTGEQLQKSLNLTALVIAPPHAGQKLHEQRGYQL